MTPAGVNPAVLHVDSPVTITFVNDDAVPHQLEEAPELQHGACPEVDALGRLAPGASGSVTIRRAGVICAYHEAAAPANVAFQGFLVVH